jgi:prephenate dehydratase
MKTKIAYQGEGGSYSSIAAEYLAPEAELVGYDSFEEVFTAVQNGEALLGLLPIENTLIGSIFEVYDLLFGHDGFELVGEVSLKIDHNLMVKKNTDRTDEERIKQIHRVYSHPKALEQCKKFFKERPWIKAVVAEDTAGAARKLAVMSKKNDRMNKAQPQTSYAGEQGVIASLKAAEIYGLKVVKIKIQDNAENYTRFVAVKRAIYQEKLELNGKGEKVGLSKTSLVFAAAHEPGSLLRCMQPFAKAHLNLTKIESRPLVGQPWKYLFYLDFEHSVKSGAVEEVLNEMQPHTMILRKLGTYPKGVVIREVEKGGKVEVDMG